MLKMWKSDLGQVIREFELASNESERLVTPRDAVFRGFLEGDGRNDWAWIRVDPPIPGQFLSPATILPIWSSRADTITMSWRNPKDGPQLSIFPRCLRISTLAGE